VGISGAYLRQEGMSQAYVPHGHASLVGMQLVGVHRTDVYLVGEFCDFDFQRIFDVAVSVPVSRRKFCRLVSHSN
jgi:hypothetical protein